MPGYKARIQALGADSKGLWGELDATRMIAHLRRAIEISLEEVPVEDRSNWFTRSVVRWYAFRAPVPWPKGKLKAIPVFLPDDARDFELERQALLDAMDQFTQWEEDRPDTRTAHPFFGPLRLGYWSIVHGRHFDFHLRQFRV